MEKKGCCRIDPLRRALFEPHNVARQTCCQPANSSKNHARAQQKHQICKSPKNLQGSLTLLAVHFHVSAHGTLKIVKISGPVDLFSLKTGHNRIAKRSSGCMPRATRTSKRSTANW